MSKAIERARADLDAGRLWQARDRLQGHLVRSVDDEVLEFLATIHEQMGDLPAAGALWFALERDDVAAQAALRAWRARNGDAQAQWFSLPSPVRRGRDNASMSRLREEAGVRRRWVDDGALDEQFHAPWGERLADFGCGGALVVSLCWGLFLMLWGAWSFSQWVLH